MSEYDIILNILTKGAKETEEKINSLANSFNNISKEVGKSEIFANWNNEVEELSNKTGIYGNELLKINKILGVMQKPSISEAQEKMEEKRRDDILKYIGLRNREARAIDSITRRYSRFKYEYLGVMFLGMEISRTMDKLLETSMDWVGTNEIMSDAMGLLFLPTALKLNDWAIGFYEAVSKLPEPIKELIGAGALGSDVFGKFLVWSGQAYFGIKGLKKGFESLSDIGSMVGSYFMAILPWVVIAGLAITSYMKQSADSAKWSQKAATDAMKEDWNAFSLDMIAKAIENRNLLPKIFFDMAYTIGSTFHDLQFGIRNTLMDIRASALSIYGLLPGQAKTASDAITALEKERTKYNEDWAKTTASATRGYLNNLDDIRNQTAVLMAEQGIPLEDIVDVYGDSSGAISALFNEANSGKISMDDLNKAMLIHWGLTKDDTNSVQGLVESYKNVIPQATDMSNQILNSTTSMDKNSVSTTALTSDMDNFMQSLIGTDSPASELVSNLDLINTSTTNLNDPLSNIVANTSSLSNKAIDSISPISNMNTSINDLKTQLDNANSSVIALIGNLDKIPTNIKSTVDIDYNYNMPTTPLGGISNVITGGLNWFKNLIGLQEGGIVTRPTLSMIGEAGPEAVIPLSQMGGMSYSPYISVNATINNEMDLRTLASKLNEYLYDDWRSKTFSR